MNLETAKFAIESGILAILGLTLLTIIYLSISRNSSINMLVSKIGNFKNRTELEIELNKQMTLLYSIVSNAVYIGLFGTVLGVMVTLSAIEQVNQKALISSLSLPLLSTAVSIVVAIIGTFIYNSVASKIEKSLKLWDIEHGNDIKTL